MHFMGTDSAVEEVQEMFSSHGSLTGETSCLTILGPILFYRLPIFGPKFY